MTLTDQQALRVRRDVERIASERKAIVVLSPFGRLTFLRLAFSDNTTRDFVCETTDEVYRQAEAWLCREEPTPV